jgi:uncharacterized protein YukE
MSDGLEIQPDAFRAAAPQFEQASDTFATAADRLQNSIGSEGQCWGRDDPGTAFASKYIDGANDALQMMMQIPGIFQSIADRIRSDADGYTGTDSNFANVLSQFQSDSQDSQATEA